MQRVVIFTAPIILGLALDLLFGEPRLICHPVRLIGKLIQTLEKLLYRQDDSDRKKFYKGMLLVVLVIAATAAASGLIVFLFWKIHPCAGVLAEGFMCFRIIAVKSLKDESMKVYARLKASDIEGARRAVSMIVGRDTQRLDGVGITKAAVETVAENTSDGVVAPLFYITLFGAVGGFVYKAVNTMDSMIGYKNEKYMYFGRAAAKFDDVFNFIPSRVAAALMIAATGAAKIFFGDKYNMKNAVKIHRRDKNKHSSPNSAQTESVCAGALQIQLAGGSFYFGKYVEKPFIGDPIREIETEDIARANVILYITSVLTVIIAVLLRLIPAFWM